MFGSALASGIASVFVLAGAVLAMLAGIGLLRFKTPYARIHASGKASPVAFVLVGIGATIELGFSAATQIGVAALALMMTMPVGIHLLFRAVYRTESGQRPEHDALASVERLPD